MFSSPWRAKIVRWRRTCGGRQEVLSGHHEAFGSDSGPSPSPFPRTRTTSVRTTMMPWPLWWWSSSSPFHKAKLDACSDWDSTMAKADPALLRHWGDANEVSGIVGLAAPLQLQRYHKRPRKKRRFRRQSGKDNDFIAERGFTPPRARARAAPDHT